MTKDMHGRGNRGQFQKGTSGNPKGRPKRKASMPNEHLSDLLWEALAEKIQVNHGGKRKGISAMKAIVLGLVSDTIKAKGIERLKFVDAIIKMLKQNPPRANSGVIGPFSWETEQEKLFQRLEELAREEGLKDV